MVAGDMFINSIQEFDRLTDALAEAYDVASELDKRGYEKVEVYVHKERISIKFSMRKEEE